MNTKPDFGQFWFIRFDNIWPCYGLACLWLTQDPPSALATSDQFI